jgi:ferrous iron transport protein B
MSEAGEARDASSEVGRERGRAPARDKPRVLLAGNPNSGKTTVYNALTGARAKVANYPGVTVELRSAKVTGPSGAFELVDLPGTYSLTSESKEEEVAVRALLGLGSELPDAVVVVTDVTTLGRSLYLALQVAETGLPMVVALTMMDDAERDGIEVDRVVIAEALGAEVVPVVASKGRGIAELKAAVARAIESRAKADPSEPDEALAPIVQALPPELGARPRAQREALARWALLSLGDDELDEIAPSVRSAVDLARRNAEARGVDLARSLVERRYKTIDAIASRAARLTRAADGRSLTERIDRVLLHPISGVLVFLVVMAVLFQTLFSWSEPAIAAIEAAVEVVKSSLSSVLPEGAIRGLVVDGIVGGVGNVVVFVPQIALLFLFIGILEDSGYLARVAFALDRVMGGVGLHGKAFVPMLSGFACAVPAVLATRTIENRRDRLLTMLVVPLTSCSARLPVFVLVSATVFGPNDRVFGVFHTGAFVLFLLYALSIVFALGAAFVLRRTALSGPRPTFVLELPPYRLPVLRNLVRSTWERVRSFLVDAGTIILAITVILWVLLAYPKSDEIAARYDTLRSEVTATGDAREEAIAILDQREAGEALEYSFAGRIGKWMEPGLEPMGQDWRIGVGILGAFAAREVFVGTMGIVFGMGDDDENTTPLRHKLSEATWPDGSKLMTPLSGVALMLFFLLASQCMSTLAVVKRESGSYKWALFLFGYMSVLAYATAVIVYQGGKLFGLGP